MATTTASAGTPASHPFTCNTCQVAFRSSELQRTHMQHDWHRYNLKRRVASLPPLSSEIFAEKVLANKASAAATAARAAYEKLCRDCSRTYYSENAFLNHLSSQRHRVNEARRHRLAPGEREEDGASVMSSTFSLGDSIQTPKTDSPDRDAEAEFARVIDGMHDASLDENGDPLSRRPTRPHHSSAEDRPEHPLSRTETKESKKSSAASSDAGTRPEGPIENCLFCNFHSPNFKLNVEHMERHHGLFVPERQYLTDLEGLVNFLHEKIFGAHECLWCPQVKHSAPAIQTHMRDKGHCMIAYDSLDEAELVEIGQFYDFSSTYSSDEFDDGSSTASEASTPGEGGVGGVKLGARRDATTSIQNGAGDAAMGDVEDAGWETDSTVSSVPTDEITALPIEDRTHQYKKLGQHRHHSHTDPRPHKNTDGFHSHAHATPHAVYHDEVELHMPSGRTAGHRAFARYFRQNLRNYPSRAERRRLAQLAVENGEVEAEDGEALDSDVDMEGPPTPTNAVERARGRSMQLAVSRANGGLGMVGVTDAKKREVKAAEKRERRREQRTQTRQQWGTEKRANMQKHYRDPLLQ